MKAKATARTKLTNARKSRAGTPVNSAASASCASPRDVVGSPTLQSGIARPGSRRGAIEALVRRSKGCTMSELMAATGWQKHSVRSAITLLRDAGCTITCVNVDGVTLPSHRGEEGRSSKPSTEGSGTRGHVDTLGYVVTTPE